MNHWMVLKIAARNVFLHRVRTLIVGIILCFGAFLAVLGHSFVDGVSSGMKNSTTQSITGDLQIYSSEAKENLSVFGNMDGSPTDVGHLDNFQKIADQILKNPQVASIVPMGTSFAQISPSNILDHFLETLRKSYKEDIRDLNKIESQKKRIRFLIEEIERNLEGKFDEVGLLSPSEAKAAELNLKTATGDRFWTDFDKNYENKIEFLANKIAPLIFDDNMIFFSYIGTDPQLFQKNFPQFEIVKGEMIPQGARGFLFHDYFYENMVKHKVARRLDSIKKKIVNEKLNIGGSKELQDQIKANIDQSAEIYLHLGPSETEILKSKLQSLLSSKSDDFRLLLNDYLKMNDENFLQRYDFFYKEVAPYLILYRVKVGDILPLNAFTKDGSSTSTNIRVFGTFRFKSFENSPLAGNFSLMDLVSFRELYGFLTEERREQNKELEAEMGLSQVGRDSIEDLFKSDKTAEKPPGSAKKIGLPLDLRFEKKETASNFTQEELNSGVFMNAAVFLKESKNLNRVLTELNETSKTEGLGIKAVSWQDAAGFIGQMTFMMKVFLNLFVAIALVLAGLMIMNSLLMAARDRKQEIGTMRAIGAHSDFIYRLFFYETLLLSLVFGGVGVLLGSLAVLLIGKFGIPANGDVATFFFSGPRLYLSLNSQLLFAVMGIMAIIAILATQYPAWMAMKISPLQAMQKRE